jgi:hypothetical protein
LISIRNRPRKSSVGPKPNSKLRHHESPRSSGSALITTPRRWSSAESASPSANEGISVRKRFVSRASVSLGGYRSSRLKLPWIAVPLDVIEATFPASTWSMNIGL